MRVRTRGDTWTVEGRTPFGNCDAVRLRGCGAANAGIVRTLLTPFDRLVAADRPPRIRAVSPRRWLHALARASAGTHPAGGLRTARDAAIDVLPYQLAPALAVLRGATRLLIADGVGLGKTIQAGLILAELAARDEGLRALVAAPAGLRDQWARELAAHFQLEAIVADAAWLARVQHDLPADVNPWRLPGIYIVSYDFLKRPEVLQSIEDARWDVVTVDEAHNAAQGTARRAAVDAAARRARHVVLLSATPHAGDMTQFEALCGLGAVGTPPDPLLVFRRTRQSASAAARRKTLRIRVRLTAHERRMHRAIAAYCRRLSEEARSRGNAAARLVSTILRKRALSCASSLARSAARRLEILGSTPDPDPLQLALPLADEEPLADDVADAMLRAPGLANEALERQLLEEVVRRARLAARNESKVRFLTRFLTRACEPAIVFTEYRDTLLMLREALSAAALDPCLLHGAQLPAERASVQQAFNTAGTLLLATDAASEGLNLHTRCRLVIHFDLPWTPTRLEQRAGRVDRIGQRQRVHEVLLVARHAAERLVLTPLDARSARAAAVTGSGAGPMEPGPESDEGARVTAQRGILRTRRGGPEHAPRDVLLSTRRGAIWRPGVICVYLVTLATRHSLLEHTELLCVHDVETPSSPAAAKRAVHRAVKLWLQAREPSVRAYVEERLAPLLAGVAGRHAAALRALHAREEGIAALLPSTAQDLVQAGLFDSREVRTRRDRMRAQGAMSDDSGLRLHALEAAASLTPSLRPLLVMYRAAP